MLNATEEQRKKAVDCALETLKGRATYSQMMLVNIWELGAAIEVMEEEAGCLRVDILRCDEEFREDFERVDAFISLCSKDCPEGLGALEYVCVSPKDITALALIFDALCRDVEDKYREGVRRI